MIPVAIRYAGNGAGGKNRPALAGRPSGEPGRLAMAGGLSRGGGVHSLETPVSRPARVVRRPAHRDSLGALTVPRNPEGRPIRP